MSDVLDRLEADRLMREGQQACKTWREALSEPAESEKPASPRDLVERCARTAYEAVRPKDAAPWEWNGPDSEQIRNIHRTVSRAVLGTAKGEMLRELAKKVEALEDEARNHSYADYTQYYAGKIDALKSVAALIEDEEVSHHE